MENRAALPGRAGSHIAGRSLLEWRAGTEHTVSHLVETRVDQAHLFLHFCIYLFSKNKSRQTFTKKQYRLWLETWVPGPLGSMPGSATHQLTGIGQVTSLYAPSLKNGDHTGTCLIRATGERRLEHLEGCLVLGEGRQLRRPGAARVLEQSPASPLVQKSLSTEAPGSAFLEYMRGWWCPPLGRGPGG